VLGLEEVPHATAQTSTRAAGYATRGTRGIVRQLGDSAFSRYSRPTWTRRHG
jgi:hypothetical protein